MPYVERNAEGKVVGVYANLQAGYAEEWLEDNDPEVIEFLTPPEPPGPVIPTTQIAARRLILNSAAQNMTDAQVDAVFVLAIGA